MFVDYCESLHKVRLTGKTLVDFFVYLKINRHNGSGAMNRKRSTLRTYLSYRKCLLNADTNAALFLSKKGNRLSIRMAEENFQYYVKAAGPFTKSKVVPHSLRHAFASHAVDGNADLLVLKALMGHASLRSTEIYVHPSKETQRKAINDHIASDLLKDMRTHRLGVLRIQAHRKTGERMIA